MTEQFNNSNQQNGYQQQNGHQQQDGYQQQNGYYEGGMPPYGGYQQPNGFYGGGGYMNTNRSLGSYLLLTILTCGIYGIVFFSTIGEDINIIASRRDRKKTMHYCLMAFVLSPLTCGIISWVWFHNVSERIGDEARARGINTDFDATTFWLWYVLGSFIIVGPFIYIHKLCETMNMLSYDYNRRGM